MAKCNFCVLWYCEGHIKPVDAAGNPTSKDCHACDKIGAVTSKLSELQAGSFDWMQVTPAGGMAEVRDMVWLMCGTDDDGNRTLVFGRFKPEGGDGDRTAARPANRTRTIFLGYSPGLRVC
jgi:hypothetical protein